MILTRESINPCILCNVLAPIFICGFFGNIICILVFLRRRFRQRSISVYFIALFFNDSLLLFISHIAKMLIFDASQSCWFNIALSKFTDLIHYTDLFDHGFLSVLTYNTTYTQIAMLIFMFMSIQRVRTFSSISYRESRTCAFLLTLIAFIYGILVSYMQLYDGFCIEQLRLTDDQNDQINRLINETKSFLTEQCSPSPTEWLNHTNSTDFICQSSLNWSRLRHQTVAYVYLPSYMSIDWPDEYANRSECDGKEYFPAYLRTAIDNLTRPFLQDLRPNRDYFLEHQFCTQSSHFLDTYANCSFPLSVRRFQKFYSFLYDRRLSVKNRYTIGFIIGTFIPSSICIISSFICLYYISNQPLIRKHSHSRAELRSLSLIFVEILLSLLSALQSYVINFFTCHRLLFRMHTDNCYGPMSDNILPMFFGSIVELFTSTSNILILMICGAQFRHELIEILHLKRCFFFKSKQQQQQQSRTEDGIHRQKQSHLVLPLRRILTASSTRHQKDLSYDPSIDSLVLSNQHKDYLSRTETEQPSDATSQCLIKLTTV